tara:strand:- start:2557 stop:2826 length:270 start_codon:yes stop_codon:yes gene_type:complete
MIETIGFVFFGIVSITQLYIIINLYKKVDFLEQVLDGTYLTIVNTINKMKEIDTLGAFEADDEAGSTFTMLKEEIDKLENLLEDKNNAA